MVSGPSPQAWGTRRWCPPPPQPGRAIPTGVGNSRWMRISSPGMTGHPHRRGELCERPRPSAARRGPSPQAWGTRRRRWRVERRRSGHPHRRGELSAAFWRAPRRCGPSPQAWGTLGDRQRAYRGNRAIPTGVGNSGTDRAGISSEAGHPHRRGELCPSRFASSSFAGPSPQAWGTLQGVKQFTGGQRAIPTGVGNSTRPALATSPATGHPHRRGELGQVHAVAGEDGGPSPQAWGTRQMTVMKDRWQRAIPTGVGNSQVGPLCRPGQSGHPHRRGELHALERGRPPKAGPSPQAWGTPGSAAR